VRMLGLVILALAGCVAADDPASKPLHLEVRPHAGGWRYYAAGTPVAASEMLELMAADAERRGRDPYRGFSPHPITLTIPADAPVRSFEDVLCAAQSPEVFATTLHVRLMQPGIQPLQRTVMPDGDWVSPRPNPGLYPMGSTVSIAVDGEAITFTVTCSTDETSVKVQTTLTPGRPAPELLEALRHADAGKWATIVWYRFENPDDARMASLFRLIEVIDALNRDHSTWTGYRLAQSYDPS
jgi:hypothetical protein